MAEIVAVAAVGSNQVIGVNNDLPWRLPGDLPRFKRLTAGQVLVMGRKTYDSIGRPLPGRTTIVITRDSHWQPSGVTDPSQVYLVSSPEAALTKAAEVAPDKTVIVAGGGEIYRALLDQVDRLEITEVELAPQGDVTFPAINPEVWQETAREPQSGFAWVTYRRIATI